MHGAASLSRSKRRVGGTWLSSCSSRWEVSRRETGRGLKELVGGAVFGSLMGAGITTVQSFSTRYRRVHLQVRCIDDFHIVSVSLFVYIILLLLIQYSCVKSVKRIRKGKHDFPKKEAYPHTQRCFNLTCRSSLLPLFLVLSMHGGNTELNIARLVR